ncbi:MAG: hypothetical protein R2690_09045 [Acidimicrobiales bacterium]
MQRHDGLARPRTALHHEHAGQLGADDLVLFALDGGDDVTELAGAGRLERRDQCAMPLEGGTAVVVVDAEGRQGIAEELVFDAQQVAARVAKCRRRASPIG